jgi:hypothetical protein
MIKATEGGFEIKLAGSNTEPNAITYQKLKPKLLKKQKFMPIKKIGFTSFCTKGHAVHKPGI